MAEFWKYLADNRTQVQTRQALLLVDLQTDFLSSTGKCPLIIDPDFYGHLGLVVAAARRQGITIVWIRTESDPERSQDEGLADGDILLDPPTETDDRYRSTTAGEEHGKGEKSIIQGSEATVDPPIKKKKNKSRVKAMGLLKKMSSRKELPTLAGRIMPPSVPSSTSEEKGPNTSEESAASSPAPDEDCFLSQGRINGPCCLRGTPGANSPDEVVKSIDTTKDMIVVKSHYSGFQETQLLISLRMQLITELFICGCGTNTGIYATIVDAVRHGFGVNIISDCMGYRVQARHDNAVNSMSEEMGAALVTSEEFSAKGTPVDKVEKAADTDRQDALHSSTSHAQQSTKMRSGLDSMTELTDALDESVRFKSSNLEALTFSDEEEDDGDDDVFMGEMKPESLRATTPHYTETDRSVSTMQSAGMRIEPKVMETPRTSPAYFGAVQPQYRFKDPTIDDNRASTDGITQISQNTDKDGAPVFNEMSRARISPSTPFLNELERGSREKDTSAKPQLESNTMSASPGLTTTSNDIRNRKGRPLNLSSLPMLGPDDTIGDGDSRIVYDFFPADDSTVEDIFSKLNDEVHWEKMHHNEGEVPRLVAVQGDVDRMDGSYPIYRHPSDQSPKLHDFSETVSRIKRRAEEIVGHTLNHALIQLYRTGEDNISEHTDKTLDIVKGSSIVNVSFGAQRTMRLRTKRPLPGPDNASDSTGDLSARQTQRIAMPHNSIFILGPRTNGNWVHGIQPDKRRAQERSEAELAFDGMRISLTFRHIGTFLNADGSKIWGQGATGKLKEQARDVVSGDEVQTQALIDAFGRENREGFGGWDRWYGEGSGVLHFRIA